MRQSHKAHCYKVADLGGTRLADMWRRSYRFVTVVGSLEGCELQINAEFSF